MKLCIITCYNQPDYIRAKTLRAAASQIDNVEVIVVKNARMGLMRHPEVFIKILKARIVEKPDAYLLTFRGYEMLLPARLISAGKPLIYDEFINPIEWVVKEQRSVEAKPESSRLYATLVRSVSKVIVSIVASDIFRRFYRMLVGSVDLILTDSRSHADISAEITGINRDVITDLPVGTEENLFVEQSAVSNEGDFTVFYYGNMLPLHGLQYVIDAALKLKSDPVRFVLIGGNKQVADDVDAAIKKGASINYKPWVEFKELPGLMSNADVCLAGPFGDTFQSQYVITGKAYQYLAMGRPIVIGKNYESKLFTDKTNALIVPQGDTAALADTILWAMKNRNSLKTIGGAGRELYNDKLSVAVIANRLQKLLAQFSTTKPATSTKSK